MSLYSQDDERAIRVQRLVEDWTKSGLLVEEQRTRLLPELKVDLRRTNRFLRATMFLFGYLILSSLTGLFAVFMNISESAFIWMSLFGAAVTFAAAQYLVKHYRLYRFGVEESAAIAAATFFVIFAATVLSSDFSTVTAFAAATVASYVLFLRFGFVYAGVAATLLAPMAVFDYAETDAVRRLIAAIVLLTIFFVARERRQDHDPDFPSDSYAAIEAVAWAALYLVTNLKASAWLASVDDVPQFYWATYVLIWILPAAGLWFAIRDRHRLMLDVNIVLAIATMLSNKPYLGAEPKPWDPIVFGLMLIVVAIGLRRWLASGPNGSRAGWVPHRLLASEKAGLAMAGSAAALVPGAPAAHPQEGPAIGGGGRSGGAGASGTY
ncbi:MAG TPA: hypothetical protein VF491_18730 [Vicinamibacterales bacterium]